MGKRKRTSFKKCTVERRVLEYLEVNGPIGDMIAVGERLELAGYRVMHAGHMVIPGTDSECDLSRFQMNAMREIDSSP